MAAMMADASPGGCLRQPDRHDFNNAKAASNEAEAKQAEVIGSALGAAAAITEDIAEP
jgi:hypothetical protein